MKRIYLILIQLCSLITAGLFSASASTDGPNYIWGHGASEKSRNWVATATLPFETDDLGYVHDSVPVSISYFDGLGRRLQTVTVNIDGSKNGIADFVEYDSRNRISRQWLSAPAVDNAGSFTPLRYLKEVYPSDNEYACTIFSYETTLDGRVIETLRPGQSRHTSTGIETEYLYNSAPSELICRKYRFKDGVIIWQANYSPNEILVTKTTDEDGNSSLTFTDPRGLTILTRKTSASGETLDTYRLYDENNRLRAIIPPGASTTVFNHQGNFPTSSADVINSCYIFNYDSLGRCIYQSVPGSGYTHYRYTHAGKPAFSADATQLSESRANWYLYDRAGRQVLHGLGVAPVSQIFQPEQDYFHKAYTEFDLESGDIFGYKRVHDIELEQDVLQANFYDDYSFLDLFPSVKSRMGFSRTARCTPRGETSSTYFSPRGHLTGTVRRVLDGENKTFLVTVYYYDRKGRVIQTKSTNTLGGIDVSSLALSFDGLVEYAHLRHTTADTTIIVEKEYKYTASRQLLNTRMRVNAGQWQTLSSNTYDEMNRLSRTSLLNSDVSVNYSYTLLGELAAISSDPFSQTLYRETRPNGSRGYLAGAISGQKFSVTECGNGIIQGKRLDASYNYTYNLDRLTKAVYAETYRSANSAGKPQIYYEHLFPDYSTSYTYDPDGNPRSITRRGPVSSKITSGNPVMKTTITFAETDHLTLSYTGNRLTKVTDSAEDPDLSNAVDFYDGADETAEYTYDSMGRLTADKNKGITGIRYNDIGLPQEIYIGENHIRYIYAADGTLLSKIYGYDRTEWKNPFPGIGGVIQFGSTGQAVQTTKFEQTARRDYCGEIIYADGELERITHEAGWLNPDGRHTVRMTDWQGNVRATWTQGDRVSNFTGYSTNQYKNLTAYYPFGLPFPDWQGDDRYLFSGKELERAEGLNLYDFHARLYDPQLLQFHCPDPLAINAPDQHPYLYCAANPIAYIDPTGMEFIFDDSAKNSEDFMKTLNALQTNKLFSAYYNYCDALPTQINVTLGNPEDYGSKSWAVYNADRKTVVISNQLYQRNQIAEFAIEEFYHAYQDHYPDTNNFNHEFEAKIIYELVQYDFNVSDAAFEINAWALSSRFYNLNESLNGKNLTDFFKYPFVTTDEFKKWYIQQGEQFLDFYIKDENISPAYIEAINTVSESFINIIKTTTEER